MTRIFTLLFTFALILPSVALSKDLRGKVVSVSDGDTITILDSSQRKHKIRLYGIDSPEGRQAFGNKAKKVTSAFTYGKIVDVNVLDRDRYGREVGLVYANGINVNGELVKKGYAWVYTKYCKIRTCDTWVGYQKSAIKSKLGLWADPHAKPPWEYRASRRSNTPQSISSTSSSSKKTTPTYGGYHGNVKSKVFHAPGCQHFNCKNCTKSFSSIGAASSAGYRPHNQCVK